MVVDAEVNKEQRRPLFGVNGVVRSKKDLTGPTLLEMSGYRCQKLCSLQDFTAKLSFQICGGRRIMVTARSQEGLG